MSLPLRRPQAPTLRSLFPPNLPQTYSHTSFPSCPSAIPSPILAQRSLCSFFRSDLWSADFNIVNPDDQRLSSTPSGTQQNAEESLTGHKKQTWWHSFTGLFGRENLCSLIKTQIDHEKESDTHAHFYINIIFKVMWANYNVASRIRSWKRKRTLMEKLVEYK